MCWARIHGDAPSPLLPPPCAGMFMAQIIHTFKRNRAVTMVQPESNRRPSQPAWCCRDFIKFGYFVGCKAEGTHPERRYTSWDTHSKRPLFIAGPIVYVWMMLPQITPGAVWERKETHTWSERTPVETSPRVAISGSIHHFLPSGPHPGSWRANIQSTSIGIFSEWGFVLLHRETSGNRGQWVPGERWGEPGLCLGLGQRWKPTRSGFHNLDQSNFTHSQLSDGDLVYTVWEEENFASCFSVLGCVVC